MIKSKHFKIHELVPKAMFEEYGEKAWRYVPVQLIETVDALKEYFNLGTMQINNYGFGGSREWSTLRTPDSPWYSYGSLHSYFMAVDFVCSHYSAEEVRNFIFNNMNLFPHVKGIELGVSWVHLDFRNEREMIAFNG